jgi:hypothetical protein
MPEIDPDALQKALLVRPLTPDDYDRVVELQRHGFPGMKPWSRAQFESHFRHFPEGQIGAEYDGRLVASSSSLVIDFDEYSDGHTCTRPARSSPGGSTSAGSWWAGGSRATTRTPPR